MQSRTKNELLIDLKILKISYWGYMENSEYCTYYECLKIDKKNTKYGKI